MQQSFNNTSSQAMVDVLQHQRDRFRQKAEDLGEEISRHQMEMSTLRLEAAALKKDNVALVERIHFLQVGIRATSIFFSQILNQPFTFLKGLHCTKLLDTLVTSAQGR